ncbi:MAG: bifunctional phosphoribosyl-AMP cyclohydrolase/phosphoribosyl-ATP diphosphatase, partial [Dehalococcoidia bacterium]|nr:bifunctional phosphoribosyl-AMP cyclohydrolase/phosphoribosyl-ATP diphosphatase [Dehalococcoidia bacterium]
ATSGNFLRVKSILKDCDADTLLVQAEPVGPVCHLGNRTCFLKNEVEHRAVEEEDLA